ncbi:MAG: hypothetical protein PWQ67_958 [Clostridia bacterium]|jgi:ArsR family transcriptional regulator|nr:hypothetical protein [Clostridia bacterium]MDN5322504.1 hypothetical protein [Clostridia bacterium]
MDKKIYTAFKALGEPTRLRIVKMLSLRSMCVCELSEVLDMLQPRVSQHLKILKEAGIVRESKEGYWVYYILEKERLHRLWHDFLFFLDSHLDKLEGYEKELVRINTLDSNEKIKSIKEGLRFKKT